uniref:Uncharacterized protein n=1 Tax=Magallana gigas TaxID=29159 RepID=A0A8W8L3K0_MAGGI
MEKSFQFCSREATIKALKSEVQKFNSRVDRACARALNLDRMTREYFTKMIPKDMNNNTPSCSGRESGNPEDGLSQGRILEFLKRPGRKIRSYMSVTNDNFHNLRGSRSDSSMEKAGSRLGVCSWFLFSAIVATKAGIIFIDFADELDENEFFGPNTLKTSLALAGVVYLLHLSSLHDAKPCFEGINRDRHFRHYGLCV